MRDEEFRQWMQAEGNAPNTVSTRLSDARRVEKYYGDLDEAFDRDGLASIIANLTYSAGDAAAGKPNPSKIPIDGQLISGLASYRGALSIYRQFRQSEASHDEGEGQADRIRAYAYRNFVEPARRAGQPRFSIAVRDVHEGLGLAQAYPNVCSALGTEKFRQMARVRQVGREGPANGSTVVFTFELDGEGAWNVAAAESMLRARYGQPDVDNLKLVSFELPDGRAIALQRDTTTVVQLWVEDDGTKEPPPAQRFESYGAERGRHADLPGRLKNNPPQALRAAGFPKPVLSVRAANAAELIAILKWYEGGLPLNRDALERLKARFLALYPDFENFNQEVGGYFEEERRYKEELIVRVRAVMESADDSSDAELGGALLDILAGSGLIHWRMEKSLGRRRAAHPGILEQAAGKLAREQAMEEGLGEFVAEAWPVLAEGEERSLPYGDSRTIPSMLLALVHPSQAFGINTGPLSTTASSVLGRALFGNNRMTADEYRAVLEFANALKSHMTAEWEWQPKDLWDVQGFIWAANRNDVPDLINPTPRTAVFGEIMPPTNLILYGPPGTGKTYATAARAVELCDGGVPAGDRAAVMERYRELVARKRIALVTFHQSYSYEDFVEGLRPDTGSDEQEGVDGGGSSAGFTLRPHPGVFKTIASLARESRGSSSAVPTLDKRRRVFKVALGRSGEEESDRLFREALADDHIVFGWGGDVDWSSAEYDNFPAIKRRWREEDSSASGKNPNIEQVFSFRSWMSEGDLVIISDGRDRFRAVGEVTGPYEYAPSERGDYNHRRRVRWLWSDPNGLPREAVYPRWFRSQSVYALDDKLLNWGALEQIVAGADGTDGSAAAGPPDPYVLIIDEINRANISKVFGELITLIEPDKRLGQENELTLTLPYSAETFGIPANLHIIGTMNTADRSIALLDTALRRRFRFEELMPDPDLLPEDVEGVRLRALLRELNLRIEYLFDRDHQIGHAYFIGCSNKSSIDEVMRTKVIPLLAEYFYEDWEKVRQALGETEDEGGFVIREAISPPTGAAADYAAERWRHRVRKEFDLAAYGQLTG